MADRDTFDLRVRMGRQGNGSVVLSIAEAEALVKLLDAIEYWHQSLDPTSVEEAGENLMDATIRFYQTQGGG